MLYTQAQIDALKLVPSAWEPLKELADIDITRSPSEVAVYAPSDGYSGINDPVRNALKNDCYAIWRMALVYKLTGQAIYAQKAQWFINEWCHTLTTVEVGQGQTDIAFNVPFMIMGAEYVRGYNNFDPNNFFHNWLTNDIAPCSQPNEDNNVAAWSVLLDTCIGIYQDNQTKINNARLAWKAICNSQIATDGTLPQEVDRSDTSDYHGGATQGIKGIAYTHFWMHAMIQAMRLHNNRGANLHTSTEGLKLRTAYERACGYVMNRPSFPYFDAITTLGKPLDSINNTGYVRSAASYFSGHKPASAILLEENSTFDPFYSILVLSKKWLG